MGVMVQSAVNAPLKDKSYQVVDITHAVHKRIDTALRHRQIYDNIAAAPATSSGEGLQETRLKQDVYYRKAAAQNGSAYFRLARQRDA